jgi:lipopolysaccharide transport system ATP-binding protein
VAPPIISVETISKAYSLGRRDVAPDTFVEALAASATAPLRNWRRLRRLDTAGRAGDGEDILWALRDVSFDVRHGEVVGIIGRNGAGKSTLLKILSRITEPTSGRIVLRGRVSSLLEVGTGFHPELTGRDNIYMNGTILGMKKREIDRKFDEIVEFSGVEKFLDTPVKRYSSGMTVRLAFSVAAHLEPEILIVDEVLAVGDAEFQKKCLGKMQDVAHGGRTVLFVSHNMAAVESLCERAVLLAAGQLVAEGDVGSVMTTYMESLTHATGDHGRFDLSEHPNRRAGFAPVVRVLSLTDAHGAGRTEFTCAEPVSFDLEFESESSRTLAFAVFVCSRGSRLLMLHSHTHSKLMVSGLGNGRVRCTVNALPLVPNTYDLEVVVGSNTGIVDHVDSAASITITAADLLGTGLLPAPTQGYFIVQGQWQVARAASSLDVLDAHPR